MPQTQSWHFPIVLLVLLGAQLIFWTQTTDRLPTMSIVPQVPGKQAVEALSMGDRQFFFRTLALQIQNSGDTFGRFTALYKYDFEKLYRWFLLLDDLDNRSNFIPTLATYYFSQTQHRPDVRYIVEYLYQHAADRPGKKWWWLVQAMYLANHKLGDRSLAVKVAQPLVTATDVPLLARQMPAFLYEQIGEYEAALRIMESIKATIKDIPPGELEFMRYFVEERLKSMEKDYPDGRR